MHRSNLSDQGISHCRTELSIAVSRNTSESVLLQREGGVATGLRVERRTLFGIARMAGSYSGLSKPDRTQSRWLRQGIG